MNTARSQRGFSLIELAVVLVIVGLLVGGGIAALNSATQQTRRIEAERQLLHIRDALYGYAMSQGRLPCPDSDYPPDGLENISGTDCAQDQGALPWVDLGLGRRDPWGTALLYRVERGVAANPDKPNFADPAATTTAPAFDLDAEADMTARDADGTNIVTNTPAIVASFGPQGSQVWADSGFNCIAAGTGGFSADENENCDDDNTFVAAEFRPPDAGSDPTNPGEGRFDDIIVWLPLPVLKSRMVDAGLLP